MIEYKNNSAEFQETLNSNELVLCNFTASWCGPCRAMAPLVEQLATQYPHIKFVKVDVDENGDSAREHDIRAMPTFILFQNGTKRDQLVGASPPKLKQMLSTLS